MALKLVQGLQITSADSIDTRLVLTQAEMASMLKGAMPPVYLAMCKDDGALYLYNSSNEKLSTTGRFRKIESSVNISSDTTSLVNTENGLEVNISTDENNILTNTENGLKVEEAASIDSDTIQGLFSTTE